MNYTPNLVSSLNGIKAGIGQSGASGFPENVANKCKRELDIQPTLMSTIIKAIGCGLVGKVELKVESIPRNPRTHAIESKIAGTTGRVAVYEADAYKVAIFCGVSEVPNYITASLGFGLILQDEKLTREWQELYKNEVTDKGYQSLLEADSWTGFHNIVESALGRLRTGQAYDISGSPWIVTPLIDECHIGSDSEVHRLGWNTEDLDMRLLFPHLADERHVVGTTTSALASLPDSLGDYQGSNAAVLKQLIESGLNVILSGPTGTGKTLCVDEVCKEMGRDYYVIEGHESLKEFDLIGSWEPTEIADKFVWAYGILVKAMQEGKLLFIDEANRMLARVLNIILGTLAGRRHIMLTAKGSEEVLAKEGFQIILAMNEGAGYAVNRLDTALLDRFDAEILFEYPDNPDHEMAIVMNAVPKIDVVRVQMMVDIARETRRLLKTEELEKCISTRGIIQWATVHMALSEHGDGLLAESAQLSIMSRVTGKDRDGDRNIENRQRLLQIIELMTGEDSIDGVR